MTRELACIERQHGKNPDAAIIWMHGLGASAEDFVPAVPVLGLPPTPGIRFIFPQAPQRPVTINNGLVMPAWYDIDPIKGPTSATAEIVESADRIEALMDIQMEAGIRPERIILAGFSQGGVIALYLGLGYRQRLGGVMALSTYLHDHEHALARQSPANARLPVFMAHGSHDPLIPISRAMIARDTLRKGNCQVQWHEYPMDHSACHEELVAAGRWIRTRLPAGSPATGNEIG